MLSVVFGGARSGKSALAVDTGMRFDGPVTFIATSPRLVGDADLNSRIAAHENERPPHWVTIEAELALADAIEQADGLVIVDCLTVWVGNLMHHGADPAAVRTASDEALAAVRTHPGHVIAVSNEVGLGIIPDNQLARRYRDQLGRTNQAWANAADQSFLMVAGQALPLRPPPDLLRPTTPQHIRSTESTP